MAYLQDLDRRHIQLLVYPIMTIIIELLLVYIDALSGFLCHTIFLFILVLHYIVTKNETHRQILPIFILPPLIRILSLTMLIQRVPVIGWQAIIGLTLFVPTILSIRLLHCSWKQWFSLKRITILDILVVLSGIPLGYIAFLLLKNAPIANSTNFAYIAINILILIVFSAFIEELIFRGVIVSIAVQQYGNMGLVISAMLYAALHFGSFSWGYIALMGGVGLVFGWYVVRTNNLWSVILAHSLMLIGQTLFWSAIFIAH